MKTETLIIPAYNIVVLASQLEQVVDEMNTHHTSKYMKVQLEDCVIDFVHEIKRHLDQLMINVAPF